MSLRLLRRQPLRGPVLYFTYLSAKTGSLPVFTTSLSEAVAEFNEKAAKFPFGQEVGREPALPAERWPAPLTEGEVVAAIRGWDRATHPVDDKTYQIYTSIADSEVLPAGAQLEFYSQWLKDGENDEYEDRVWWVRLTVMTSKATGYQFPIRKRKLDRRRALSPTPGYSWVLDPAAVTPGLSTGRLILFTEVDHEGALEATVAWSPEVNAYDARVVAFDNEANRCVGSVIRRGATSEFVLGRFRFDPDKMPARSAKFLGFEALTDEGVALVSEAAVHEAKEKGIEILPIPRLGMPYEFMLTTTTGDLIDSRKLRGKVVLVDCWASWCRPCMKKCRS